MIENQKILLTVFIGGRFAARPASKQSKELRSKVKASPYESAIMDSKGNWTGKYLTPKGHFKAPNNHVDWPTVECKRITMISEEAVIFFASNNCPNHINKKVWEKMNRIQRIEYHLGVIAEGNEYKYELIG